MVVEYNCSEAEYNPVATAGNQLAVVATMVVPIAVGNFGVVLDNSAVVGGTLNVVTGCCVLEVVVDSVVVAVEVAVEVGVEVVVGNLVVM